MKLKQLNSSNFNLNSRVVLLQLSDNKVAIVKKRKNRIILKDGIKIVEQAKNIKKINIKIEVSIIILDNNICSKTVKLLGKNNIKIISI